MRAIEKRCLGAVSVALMVAFFGSAHLHAQEADFDHGNLMGDGTAPSVLGDCAGCHTADSALPDGHVPTGDMNLSECRTCHAPQSEMSLRGEMPLDHSHALAGVGCASCHDASEPVLKEPATAVCQSCHGSLEDLAALTVDVVPTNPHSSPHGAPFVECSLCHMQHEDSQDFCASCHEFDFSLP